MTPNHGSSQVVILIVGCVQSLNHFTRLKSGLCLGKFTVQNDLMQLIHLLITLICRLGFLFNAFDTSSQPCSSDFQTISLLSLTLHTLLAPYVAYSTLLDEAKECKEHPRPKFNWVLTYFFPFWPHNHFTIYKIYSKPFLNL